MTRSVLVTDGNERVALAVTRSLGQAGFWVRVCSPGGRSLAGASRFAVSDERVPPPLEDPAGFAAAVAALVEERSVDVLLPMSEASLLAVLGNPSVVGNRKLCVPFADLESFRRISDKSLVTRIAPEEGLAVPEEWTVRTRSDVESLDPAAVLFPVVLKPSRSVARGPRGPVKLSVRHARDWNECKAHLDALPPAAFPVLVQRRVVGPGTGIFLLLWDSEVRAVFAHRRLREKPPSGGVSVYRESVPADPMLTERSVALLHRFDWRGVAMVEYKVDSATGVPYLMEVNGRFWGSLQLAIDAGVDFPRLLLLAADGVEFEPVRSYRLGVRSRWWWGDVDHLLIRLRRSARDLSLPPDAPGRVRAAVEFSKLWRPGDRSEILRLSDPRPFLRESVDWVLRR